MKKYMQKLENNYQYFLKLSIDQETDKKETQHVKRVLKNTV